MKNPKLRADYIPGNKLWETDMKFEMLQVLCREKGYLHRRSNYLSERYEKRYYRYVYDVSCTGRERLVSFCKIILKENITCVRSEFLCYNDETCEFKSYT